MNQIRIGAFLKELRKEKELTQEQLAEKLNVSGRTVSRWETGSNMPDIGMLVEIAEFYGVSIPEIIEGERKSEKMEKETKDTAYAVAEYGKNEAKKGKLRIAGALLAAFGLFIIITALTIFPSESSWGSIYSIFGGMVLTVGVYLTVRAAFLRRAPRIIAVAVCTVLLFAAFALSDYVAVSGFNQVPRFRYETVYDSRRPDSLTYKTLFFTAIRENPGTGEERVFIDKQN